MDRRTRTAIAAGAAGVVVAYGLVLLTTPQPDLGHDSAIDAILDSRWLIAGARLLIGLTIVYLLVSIGVRAWRRQWVRSAGGIDTDVSAARVSDDRELLRSQLQESQRTVSSLRDLMGRMQAANQDVLTTMETRAEEGDHDDHA